MYNVKEEEISKGTFIVVRRHEPRDCLQTIKCLWLVKFLLSPLYYKKRFNKMFRPSFLPWYGTFNRDFWKNLTVSKILDRTVRLIEIF